MSTNATTLTLYLIQQKYACNWKKNYATLKIQHWTRIEIFYLMS